MYSTMILVFLGLETIVSIESSSKDLYKGFISGKLASIGGILV